MIKVKILRMLNPNDIHYMNRLNEMLPYILFLSFTGSLFLSLFGFYPHEFVIKEKNELDIMLTYIHSFFTIIISVYIWATGLTIGLLFFMGFLLSIKIPTKNEEELILWFNKIEKLNKKKYIG